MYSLKELWYIIFKVEIKEGWGMLKKWIKYGRSFTNQCNVSYSIIEEIVEQIHLFNEIRSRDTCPIGYSIEEWNAQIDRLEYVAQKHLETYYELTQSQIYFETEFWKLLKDCIYRLWL